MLEQVTLLHALIGQVKEAKASITTSTKVLGRGPEAMEYYACALNVVFGAGAAYPSASGVSLSFTNEATKSFWARSVAPLLPRVKKTRSGKAAPASGKALVGRATRLVEQMGRKDARAFAMLVLAACG